MCNIHVYNTKASHYLINIYVTYNIYILLPAVTIEEVKSFRDELISLGLDPIEDTSGEDDQSEASLDLEKLDYEDESEVEEHGLAELIPNDNKQIMHLCEKLHDKRHLIIATNTLSIEKVGS